MTDLDALRKLLCERLCENMGVEQRPDGALMLRTRFEFPDGDRYPIHLAEAGPGGLRLSDRGHTLMHISYEHDVDAFLDGTRGMLLERIMGESGLQWDGGAFCLDTPPERLPEAIFAFGQALTRLYDLTLLSRSNVGSTFYDNLADLLFSLVDEAKIERDYQPEVPNADVYPVDYRIEGRDDVPLFLYGVPNRDKARLTTIMLSHFHRHSLRFESILVFEDQAEIPRRDLARLGETFRCRRRHDLVAGVMGGFQPKSLAACRSVTPGERALYIRQVGAAGIRIPCPQAGFAMNQEGARDHNRKRNKHGIHGYRQTQR